MNAMRSFLCVLLSALIATPLFGADDPSTRAVEPATRPGAPPAADLSNAAPSSEAPIDWSKARALLLRERNGEKLSADERSYLERAKAARRNMPAPAADPRQRKAPDDLTPLCDLLGDQYLGHTGGLYGDGANRPPAAHAKAAEAQLARIQPLDSSGDPSERGTIVFVSLSMSNATQEFSHFKRIADAAPEKSPQVTIVDCAQGGQAMAEWAPADGRPWSEAMRRLAQAGVTAEQVQVAWIKLANKQPRGALEEHTRKLESDTLAMLQNARQRFPNLRIAYLGSRTYGGYAVGPLNPEPYAYESAFPAQWLIRRQIAGDPELQETKSPLLLWGPYLWANGTKGRKIDGLIWERADFVADGVHPSASGREKVARLLLDFFTRDPLAKRWFAK